MPALGMAQETGKLVEWLKAEGDTVVKGEPLMEVETDKATVEIEAPASGILANVIASPGDEVPVGNKIALILAPGEKTEGTNAPRPSAVPARAEAAPQSQAKVESAPARAREGRPSGIIPASPAARRIAREKGLDLSTLSGTGPEGAILAQDVVRCVAPDTSGSGGPH